MSNQFLQSMSEGLIHCGCPFISDSHAVEEVSGMLLTCCPEREKILRWCLDLICPGTGDMKMVDLVQGLGICKNNEQAKRFSGSEQNTKDQERIWKLILQMIQPKVEKTADMQSNNTFTAQQNCGAFTDAIAESGILDKLLTAPIQITPYKLERELKAHKLVNGKVPVVGVFEKIQKTLEKESDACRSRISEQKATATTTINSANRLSEGGDEDNADVLNNLDEKSAAVCEISTEFKNKFLSDLKPWINKRSEKVVERPELEQLAARLDKFGTFWSATSSLSSSSDLVENTSLDSVNELVNMKNMIIDQDKFKLVDFN